MHPNGSGLILQKKAGVHSLFNRKTTYWLQNPAKDAQLYDETALYDQHTFENILVAEFTSLEQYKMEARSPERNGVVILDEAIRSDLLPVAKAVAG